jgi:cell division protein DivIC
MMRPSTPEPPFFNPKTPSLMNNHPLMQEIRQHLHAAFKNRYILVAVCFLVWVTFFDKSRLISQWQLERDIARLESEKANYAVQIRELESEKQNIENDKERYARERYFLSKENEQVYILED